MNITYGFSSLHIIESLGESDGNPGNDLLQRLSIHFNVKNIAIHYHTAFDEQGIYTILDHIYDNEVNKGDVPILHFEAHGDHTGLILRDKSTMLWESLSARLTEFNIKTNFNLLVVLSCCDGIHQIKTLSTHSACPFSALVGCEGTIHTDELLNGFEHFYKTLLTEESGTKALSTLQNATTRSQGTKFTIFTCVRAYILTYIRILKSNTDPKIKAARITHYKSEAKRIRALQGNNQKTTRTEIAKLLKKAEDKTLNEFHKSFFATAAIPSNSNRFSRRELEKLVRDHAATS